MPRSRPILFPAHPELVEGSEREPHYCCMPAQMVRQAHHERAGDSVHDERCHYATHLWDTEGRGQPRQPGWRPSPSDIVGRTSRRRSGTADTASSMAWGCVNLLLIVVAQAERTFAPGEPPCCQMSQSNLLKALTADAQLLAHVLVQADEPSACAWCISSPAWRMASAFSAMR